MPLRRAPRLWRRRPREFRKWQVRLVQAWHGLMHWWGSTGCRSTTLSGGFLPAVPNLQYRWQAAEKYVNQLRVEVLAALFVYQICGLADRPGFLVGAFAGEGIKHVRQCHNSG